MLQGWLQVCFCVHRTLYFLAMRLKKNGTHVWGLDLDHRKNNKTQQHKHAETQHNTKSTPTSNVTGSNVTKQDTFKHKTQEREEAAYTPFFAQGDQVQ
jgi:hypothetical protein